MKKQVSSVQVSGDTGFQRHVIEGIPRIGYYQGGNNCPEDIPFPAVMRTLVRFLGEDWGVRTITSHGSSWYLDLAVTKFAAIGGCCFRFLWQIMESNGIDAEYAWDEPELPFARAFAAAGFSYRMLLNQDFAPSWQGERLKDQAQALELIKDSIDAGTPVIALGVVGPPEPCIITGYDEDGEVLTGWSYFQHEMDRNPDLEFEPTGYFRKGKWFSNLYGLVLAGERVAKPHPAEICRDVLTWAVELMHTPRAGRFPAGFDAYSYWIEALLFPDTAPDKLPQAMAILEPAIWDLAERRWYAAMYLEQMAVELPQLRHQFLEAAKSFQAIHDLMWEVNGQLRKTEGDSGMESIADPVVRRRIIGIIKRARQYDLQGAEQLAKLAAAL
ncbi:MAG TPA: hypothetical protein PKN71_07140 [Bacillota bacterium]|nr:hypothetical protein [Bacillota bacterium]